MFSTVLKNIFQCLRSFTIATISGGFINGTYQVCAPCCLLFTNFCLWHWNLPSSWQVMVEYISYNNWNTEYVYNQIYTWWMNGLCNNLHLSCKSIILYAIVFLFSEDNKSKKTKGVRYKQSICRISM